MGLAGPSTRLTQLCPNAAPAAPGSLASEPWYTHAVPSAQRTPPLVCVRMVLYFLLLQCHTTQEALHWTLCLTRVLSPHSCSSLSPDTSLSFFVQHIPNVLEPCPGTQQTDRKCFRKEDGGRRCTRYFNGDPGSLLSLNLTFNSLTSIRRVG